MELFVFEQEEVVSNAPVIKVLELEDKSWVFELWADKIKLFGAQDLISCLVSFYELCFSFKMNYGRGAQVMCSIIQRKVAEYGLNGSNTLTHKKNNTANKQIKNYVNFSKIHS